MKSKEYVIIAVILALLFSTMGASSALRADTDNNKKVPGHLSRVASSWKTDWSKTSIDLNELMSGGPPRDGIPPIDRPSFETISQAGLWLKEKEPVIVVEFNGESRAYPLQILTWHEIVNDEVGSVPVAVTFCPLCNSAMTFDRRVNGEVNTFGTSGLLRDSDLVMWDRNTESLWQQITGKAIVGELNGAVLTYLPSSLTSFSEFMQSHPDGKVLSKNTGHNRPYGENPYVKYDQANKQPFLFRKKTDRRLQPMERVVSFSLGDDHYAISQSWLSKRRVANKKLSGVDVVAFHQPGTASALDGKDIASSRDVGSTGLFKADLDGQKLTFAYKDNRIVDEQTGSTWNVLGKCIDGKFKGKELEQLPSGDHFWFAWAAFRPDTELIK